MKQFTIILLFSIACFHLHCQIYTSIKEYGEVRDYTPKLISKELAKSHIEEMWMKSPYSNPVSVEVKDNCMLAHYSDIKGGMISSDRATKGVTKGVFYREIREIRVIVKGDKWFVELRNKDGKGLRNFRCKDKELALGFVDALYYYKSQLPKD